MCVTFSCFVTLSIILILALKDHISVHSLQIFIKSLDKTVVKSKLIFLSRNIRD